MLNLVSKIVNEKFASSHQAKLSEIVMKTQPNKVQILNENGDKQSQNTQVEVDIFARQNSKARSRVWIVQNNLHIAETLTKGTSTKLDANFAAEMNCTRHFIEHGRAYIKILFMMAQQDLDRTSARAML